MLNMLVTISYLVLIAKYSPSKTPQYNFGNLIMHVIIIYFYIISLLLNPRVNLQDSAIDNVVAIDASLVITQSALFIFLLLVSFKKMSQLWVQAKAQVQAERAAEDLVEEHVEYFEQLRVHFSDQVAIALTNAHHYGGFGAVIGDMAEQRRLGEALSDAKRSGSGRQATFANPLQEVSDDEGESDGESED
jgi:hypothetical protein